MPYLQQHQAQQIRESRERQANGGAGTGDAQQLQQQRAEEARIQCQHNIVKHQVEEMYKSTPARSTEEDDFYRYNIDVSTVIFQGTYSSIYLATHQDQPDFPLVGRVYEPSARIDPQRSSYMKVLKHIGKRSPACIATWDIFYDDAGRVVIFQEFAIHGNLKDYLQTNNVYVPEEQMHEWARDIYAAMSFLGDAGICHRAISPKHVLLSPSPDDTAKTLAKLGSFRDSVIYFDHVTGRVRPQPCREKANGVAANFQAPEVFAAKNVPKDGAKENNKSDTGANSKEADGGASNSTESASKELREPSGGRGEYDPIVADIYSYGSTFFFSNTRNYPVQYSKTHDSDLGPVIQKSINYAKNLTPEAKNWFSGLLKPDPTQRTKFDAIAEDTWFKNGPSKSDDPQQKQR